MLHCTAQMKCALKPTSLPDVRSMTNDDMNGSYRNTDQDNILSAFRLCMRARLIGLVESAWSVYKFRHGKIDHPNAAYTMHLENNPNIIISHPSVQRNLSDFAVG